MVFKFMYIVYNIIFIIIYYIIRFINIYIVKKREKWRKDGEEEGIERKERYR